MAERLSIFSDDWRDCLQEQYRDVVRRNDKLTEETLIHVLHSVGFTDDELREIKLYATMRTEDLQGDFVPDLDVSHHDHAHHEPHDHDESSSEPTVFAGVEIEPSEPIEPLPDEELEMVAEEEPEPDAVDIQDDEPSDDEPDPNAATQMSLF